MALPNGERDLRLLVLGAGPAQLGLIEAAAARGIWTAVCDRDPGAPGFRLADRRCIVGAEDETALERLAAALDLDGVIAPGADWAVGAAARIAEKLGLPHPIDPATAVRATNKLRQREALAAAGVPQPRWEVASECGPALDPPLVVKAADRQGRNGLSLVTSASELAAAVAGARAVSRSGVVLVEEYVGGPEVTVTGYSAGGEFMPLAVSDRITAEPPAFGVALAHVWPSSHAEAAAEVTRRAVAAVGIACGPSSTRLRLSAGGPEVIGVAARLGAGHEAELVEAATGVDLHGLALAAAFGDGNAEGQPARSHDLRLGGAVMRFLSAPGGLLERVEAPQGMNGVVRAWIYREPGEMMTPTAPAAAVLAVGSTREEGLARAEAAAERIRFVTADAHADAQALV